MRFQSRAQACEVLGDGTLAFTWVGVVDPSDVAALFNELKSKAPRAPGRLLWDMTSTHLLPGETRRKLLEELIAAPPIATAVLTSEFFVRVPVTMLLEVVATESPTRPPYGFFEDRGDAIAWLGARAAEAG